MYATPQDILAELRVFWSLSFAILLQPTPLIQHKALQWLGWLPPACHHKTALGFTLAELLIVLTILGVIATFTIPKIIISSQNNSYNAITKEAAAAMTAAYQSAKNDGLLDSQTGIKTFKPYLNYIAVDTSSVTDGGTCGVAGWGCLKLANGAVIFFEGPTNDKFGGTAATNAIWFQVDPDGTANGQGTQGFWLLYNGRLTTYSKLSSTIYYGGCCNYSPPGAADASWFSW